jgi:DNA-binding transcriptional regulator YdaS (Cro superfamily)
MNLRSFLDGLPRGGSAEFADRVGCSTVYLSQLAARQGGREASPQLAVVIERASNYTVRRWDMRPSDWHLIWPELIRDKDAPPIPTEPQAQAA